MSEQDLDNLVLTGAIAPETYIWRAGMAEWQPYSSLKAVPAAVPEAAPATSSGLRISSATHHAPAAAAPVSDEAACSQCGTVLPRSSLTPIGSSLVCGSCRPAFINKMQGGPGAVSGAFEYGGVLRRWVAMVIDNFVINLLKGVIGVAMGVSFAEAFRGRGSDDPKVVMVQVIGLGLLAVYEICMVGFNGATFGKQAMGLRVVKADGTPVGFLRALARFPVKYILCIGWLVAIFDSQKRGLHDMICGTRVVRE